MELVKLAAPSGEVLQLKIRLLGVSPMVWRRVLVPESMSLHELHGVVQLAMGWEGIQPVRVRSSRRSIRGTVPVR